MFYPQGKPSDVGLLGQWANAYVNLLTNAYVILLTSMSPPRGSQHSAFLPITCESDLSHKHVGVILHFCQSER